MNQNLFLQICQAHNLPLVTIRDALSEDEFVGAELRTPDDFIRVHESLSDGVIYASASPSGGELIAGNTFCLPSNLSALEAAKSISDDLFFQGVFDSDEDVENISCGWDYLQAAVDKLVVILK